MNLGDSGGIRPSGAEAINRFVSNRATLCSPAYGQRAEGRASRGGMVNNVVTEMSFVVFDARHLPSLKRGLGALVSRLKNFQIHISVGKTLVVITFPHTLHLQILSFQDRFFQDGYRKKGSFTKGPPGKGG